MDIILIPGLWLDARSWDDVVPALQSAGHRVRALTLPGVGEAASASGDIGISHWVDAVVAEVDAHEGPVVLVGHSGGGNVAWGAAEARADRVAHVVFVDTTPPPPGADISEFPVVDGVVPFPGWDFFDADDTADLDAATRARTASLARSVPARVPSSPLPLAGVRRHAVPVTLLMGGVDDPGFRGMVSAWGDFAAEFSAIASARIVKLGTGHWPQFSQPGRLADAIVAALP